LTLFNLLTERRQEILEKCQTMTAEAMGSRTTTYLLERGLPTLYEELIEVLRTSLSDDSHETRKRVVSDTITAGASRQHARESFRLGYTVSQLVHGYGCICQGITDFANEEGFPISISEFSQLNMCLDVAIAQAVSEFEEVSLETADQAEALRLGSLAHEMRNYLTSAIMAHELIRSGGVGGAGATGGILTAALQQMKTLIDRAVVEVRLHGQAPVELAKLQILNVLSEVESSALPEANAKFISLRVEADPSLEVQADRHLVVSALANLVQNAIKFTHPTGNVWIRAFADHGSAVIEIEDQCGGLPPGMPEGLFAPFAKKGKNQSGLGLGLSIARRAISSNGGTLAVLNLPERGCVFTVELPLVVEAREAVS
jgi:signal transduction histidine kinase